MEGSASPGERGGRDPSSVAPCRLDRSSTYYDRSHAGPDAREVSMCRVVNLMLTLYLVLSPIAAVAAAGPDLTVVTPTAQQAITGPNVTVEFKSSNFNIVPSSVPVSELGKHP